VRPPPAWRRRLRAPAKPAARYRVDGEGLIAAGLSLPDDVEHHFTTVSDGGRIHAVERGRGRPWYLCTASPWCGGLGPPAPSPGARPPGDRHRPARHGQSLAARRATPSSAWPRTSLSSSSRSRCAMPRWSALPRWDGRPTARPPPLRLSSPGGFHPWCWWRRRRPVLLRCRARSGPRDRARHQEPFHLGREGEGHLPPRGPGDLVDASFVRSQAPTGRRRADPFDDRRHVASALAEMLGPLVAFDVRAELGASSVPTQVVVGTRDVLTAPTAARPRDVWADARSRSWPAAAMVCSSADELATPSGRARPLSTPGIGVRVVGPLRSVRVASLAEQLRARSCGPVCVRCPLSEGRTQVVSGGRPDRRPLVRGRGPGGEEDLAGEPFVGRSGKPARPG